jgi:receptor protein-tyrosine kinase
VESITDTNDSAAGGRKTLADTGALGIPLEQYRVLALSLERIEPRGTNRTLVITSALPAEGKTLTVANLGWTLNTSFRRRVLVVDADLRRPRLYSSFESNQTTRDVNTDLPASLQSMIRLKKAGESLYAAAFSDVPYRDPINTLNAPAVAEFFEWARARFDWVLVDSPPAAVVPDAHILARLVDGVLFVVRAAVTPYDAAALAVEQIGRERVLGVVMNRVPDDSPDGSFRYQDEYGDYYLTGERKEGVGP